MGNVKQMYYLFKDKSKKEAQREEKVKKKKEVKTN